jgi:hypothetical protein
VAQAPAQVICALSILLWTGCNSLPVSFPPPAQRASLGSGNFVMMSDPGADAFIVQGFRAKSEGGWRWAHDHPVLRFTLPDTGPLKFTMDFTLPEGTFRETGPVTLAIAINGRPFDRPRYDHPGDYQYTRAVPDELLHKNGANLVAIDPDKCATAEKLGFVLSRAGFAE